MGTQIVIQRVLLTVPDKILAACSNMQRRREDDGMLS